MMVFVRTLCIIAINVMIVPTALAQRTISNGLDPSKTITQYVHESWQIKDGLPQNSVQSIAQTPDGYLWFTTQEGLTRFDGIRFRVFDKKNSSLPENYCNSLATDHSGAVWVATHTHGIIRLQNGKLTSFTTNNGLSSNFTPENSRALLIGPDSSVWIATLGGGVNRLKNGKISVYSTQQGLSNSHVYTLFMDGNSTLWIGTESGLNILHGKTGKVQPIKMPSNHARANAGFAAIQAITRDKQGNIWIGTNNGLYRYSNGEWATYTTQDGLPGNHIRSLMCDSRGTLWIGTIGAGLCRYRSGVFSTFSAQDGLTHTDVFDIVEDFEGSLYIGTGGGGLNRLRNGSVTVYSRRLGLADPWSVMEDKDGNMWFSMFANGISVVKAGTSEVHHYSTKDGLPSNNAHGMMQDTDGSLWIGTRDQGMCHLVHGKIVQRYGVQDGLANERVRVFLRDRKGRLWVGTDKGVSILNKGVFTNLGKAEGLSDGRTPVLHEDRTGKIWIGTREGLFVMENDTVVQSFTVKNGMAGDNIIWLSEDKNGVFWVGTNNGGLHRIKGTSITAYTTKNGLFDDSVFSVLEDDYGWLWMSCSKGVFRVKKVELEDIANGKQNRVSCVVYGTGDGMATPECNGGSQPAAWKSRDGRLWFPTIAGAVVINPGNLVKNNRVPAVIIEEVWADGHKIAGSTMPATAEPIRTAAQNLTKQAIYSGRVEQGIRLSPSTEKFEFHYTATCLTAGERVQFKYMLEGYDNGWVEAGTRRTAYYTNLPHGKRYRFRVLACNNDGIWNETGDSVTFSIAPHWYESWWFYSLCLLIMVVTAGGVYRWRINRLRERAMLLENLIAERTVDLHEANQEITRQMEQLQALNENLSKSNQALDEANRFKTQMLSVVSHDLKNPLTTVQVASEYLRPKTAGDEETQEFIDMIQTSARIMSNLIVEILDQAAIQYGQLDLRCSNIHFEEICHELLYEYKLRAGEKQQHLKTAIENDCLVYGDGKRLRQVVDNLISNAVKYSPIHSTIRVRLYKQTTPTQELVRFEVQDEGPGLTPDDQAKLFGFFQRLSARPTGGESSTGVGLSIVKQIVELHGGRVWCESEPGWGATFIMELPCIVSPDENALHTTSNTMLEVELLL